MKIKSAPARFKAPDDAATGDEGGTFEALVSVFDNVDSWGDVVMPGAFADSIAEWKASANTLPVLWSHRMDDPAYNIGEVVDIAELEPGAAGLPEWVDPWVKEHGGLWIKARIDTGPDASPIAVQGLRLLKQRRVTQFSYAYDVEDGGPRDGDNGGVFELRKLKLYEVSPTQIGANELTDLLAVPKAHMVGRKLTVTADERDQLQGAIAALAEALDGATVEGEEPSTEPTTTDEPAADAVSEQDAKRGQAARTKAGRSLSAKNEANIRDAVKLLTATLESLDSSDDDSKAKRERPDGAKREGISIPSIRLLTDLAAMRAEISI